MIHMRHCVFHYTPEGCSTYFKGPNDSVYEVPACPHDTHHYHVIAHRCGYGDDIMSYCREHEFCHNFMEEALFDRPSPVLFSIATGKMPTGRQAVYEEITAQTMQRWLRAKERPILSGIDWDGLKDQALEYLRREP